MFLFRLDAAVPGRKSFAHIPWKKSCDKNTHSVTVTYPPMIVSHVCHMARTTDQHVTQSQSKRHNMLPIRHTSCKHVSSALKQLDQYFAVVHWISSRLICNKTTKSFNHHKDTLIFAVVTTCRVSTNTQRKFRRTFMPTKRTFRFHSFVFSVTHLIAIDTSLFLYLVRSIGTLRYLSSWHNHLHSICSFSPTILGRSLLVVIAIQDSIDNGKVLFHAVASSILGCLFGILDSRILAVRWAWTASSDLCRPDRIVGQEKEEKEQEEKER